MNLTFEWDEIKAKENILKHKISFDKGKTIFNDPFLLTYLDTDNCGVKERFINIGVSAKGRILVLIPTERLGNIRIISCRKATLPERRHYEET